jgi:hypothetical protein
VLVPYAFSYHWLNAFFWQDPSPAEPAAASLPVEDDETLAPQTLGSEDGKLDGLGNNIVKVTSQYGVDATLSPLVLHAVKILLPAWYGNTVCSSKLMIWSPLINQYRPVSKWSLIL